MNKKKINFTATDMWLLPMFRIPHKEWQRAGLQNSYLQDSVFEKTYEGLTVRLLFKVDEEKYQLIEDAISTIPEFKDMYGHGAEIIVVVLRIPEEFESDYDLIIQGKYSNLSPEYRDLVSDKLDSVMNEAAYKSNGKRLQMLVIEKNSKVKSVAAKVIQNMDNVAEGQIWEKPVLEQETITAQIIKQLQENGD